MAVYTRPRTWTGMWPAWGREKSIDFHTKLRANGPIWTSNQTGTVAKIAAGEYPMGCGLPYHSYLNIARRDKTAAMAFVVPKEVPIQIGEAFAIMKGAKNPNAAILFAAYLASSEGQKSYKLYGRSTPFIDGTFADEHIKSFNAKVIFGGWDFAGKAEADAAKAIVEAWGFPKGK
jgi:ABC-type Fe3+ transport system substrate-binding protein